MEAQTVIKAGAMLEGTARYRARFKDVVAEDHFRQAQNLWLSSIGIGTYLGEANEECDRRYMEAIVRAVELGVNLIDTAANYRFKRSERSVGAALKELFARGFARDEIIVCTKGGYLPFDGAPPRDVWQYIEETFVRPGIASFADIAGGAHCMTPRYLQNQLRQSLRNLGLDWIDVYYLHNPESQLSSVSPEEFSKRLRAAFEFLEQKVVQGQIKNYGVATWNGFRAEPDAREYHSLEQMVGLARDLGDDDHHFRFIQLPFNLAMPEALFFQNQKLGDEYVSVLEAARAFGVTAIASGSILQGQVSRGLPEAIREPLGSLATDAQTGIQFVRSAPGITTALVGMSRVAHVEENLQLVGVARARAEDLISVFDQEE
ncbi:MAG: aldo/keto reductase [Acidobacteria bacterium]|nr:MAG: aldo/keto reductase [Acidobacteriota bacterium]